MPARSSDLPALPAVETVLQQPAPAAALRELPRPLVVEAVRAELSAERGRLRARDRATNGPPAQAAALAARAAARARGEHRPQLVRVLNATGVVLHTNLGRAP